MRRITSSMFWGVVVLLGIVSKRYRSWASTTAELLYATQQAPAAFRDKRSRADAFKVCRLRTVCQDAKKVLVSAHWLRR
jgi:hypothetical protein